MLKVMVIGSPGAGKSTFARALRDATGLPLYYLDMLWHRPDRTTISKEAFQERLAGIMKQDRWILDGNYKRTLEMRLQECDTVFLLDYPLETCLLGVQSRIGKKREDLPWLETELDEEFRQWVMNFPNEQRPMIYALLDKYQENRDIHIFRYRKQAEDYLRMLRQRI